MAIVSGNTTAIGYGQPKPVPAPPPSYPGMAAPVPVYNDRDPNNPAVVWDEQYQRWYDTKSGLWRNPDTGVWENWAGSQVWDPATGKMVAADKANIINPASIAPTGAGVAAAKALIDSSKTNIIARPDTTKTAAIARPDTTKTAADFAALSGGTPFADVYEGASGLFQGPGTPGVPERNAPISLAGLENVPYAYLDPNRNTAPVVEPPGVSYLRDSAGNVMYEQNIMGEYVPVERATMSGLEMLASGASALTASPYQLEEFDPIRERLPDFVNESIEFGTSPVGIASNVFLPFSGASTLGANIALNVGQDLAFGAAKVGAKKLGAPEPVAYGLGLLTSVATEAAVGRAVAKATAGAQPPVRIRPPTAPTPVPDMFTGRDVRVLLPDGSTAPGVDMGPGLSAGSRAVQLPDGQITDIQQDVLEHLAPRQPLTIAHQVDEVLSDAPLADPRAAMAYPDDTPVVSTLRPASAVDDVRAFPSGVVRYKDEVLGKVEKAPDGRWQAIDNDGVVKTYATKKSALESLGNDYDVARGAKPVTSLVLDVRKAVDMSEPAQRDIADAVTAAVLDPSPQMAEASSDAIRQAVEPDTTFIGMRMGDVAYVLRTDSRGRVYRPEDYNLFRKLDEAYTAGTLTREEEVVRAGLIKEMKDRYRVLSGGREPVWTLSKDARPEMYQTRELHQSAIITGLGGVRDQKAIDEIMSILPEGPGLKTMKRGGETYMHGNLASYMSGDNWRKTLELERAALAAKSKSEYIDIKLKQAAITGGKFDPADPATHYPPKLLDNPAVKRAADAAVKDTPLDVAVEGSPAHARALRAATGEATPAEMVVHEAEQRAIADAVLKDAPEAVIPTNAQMKGLVAAAEPEKVKSRARTVAGRTGRAAGEVALAPVVAMRSLLLSGDGIMGRQLVPALGLYPERSVPAVVRTLRNVRNRDELWRYIARVAEERPHLAPYLVTKGVPGSLEEEVTFGKWITNLPGLKQIEDINALMKNLVRINLDQKFMPMSEGWTPAQIANRTHMISVLTGRGAGKFLDDHAAKLNVFSFISARYTASRFQFWGLILPFRNDYTGMGINAMVDKRLYAEHLARMVAATTVLTTALTLIGNIPGVEAVTETTSSKFGKFKWKGMWYDFTGGLTDPIRLFSQMATLKGTTETGSTYKFDSALQPLQSYIEARMPPVARFAAEKLGYVSPFQERPMFPGQPEWVSRYVPLPIASIVEMIKKARDNGFGFWDVVQLGTGVALTEAGFGVSPMGARATYEEHVVTDPKARKALQNDDYWKPGSKRKSFDDLSKTGIAYVYGHPEIFGARPTSGMSELRRNAEIVDNARKNVRSLQMEDDFRLEHGDMSPKDWRKAESKRASALSASLNAVYGEWEGEKSDDVVDRYFDYIDSVQFQVGTDEEGNPINDVDWEAVDRWRGKLSDAERSQLDRYFEIQSEKGTKKQREYDKARGIIEDSGYWTLKDTAYEVWRRDHPELPETYDAWREATYKAAFDAELAATGGNIGAAYNAASAAQSALEREMGFTEVYKNTVLYPWVQANPEAADAAIEWQYYTPDNAVEKALFKQDAAELVSSQATYSLRTTVEPLYKPSITTAWQTWAGDNLGVTLSTGKGPGDFADVQAFKDAYTADLETAKRAEVGRDLTVAEKDAIGAKVADDLKKYIDDTIAAGATRFKYTEGGELKTTYLSRRALDELNAIVAAYQQNPDAVAEALRMGVIKDMGKGDKAYLKSKGVSW